MFIVLRLWICQFVWCGTMWVVFPGTSEAQIQQGTTHKEGLQHMLRRNTLAEQCVLQVLFKLMDILNLPTILKVFSIFNSAKAWLPLSERSVENLVVNDSVTQAMHVCRAHPAVQVLYNILISFLKYWCSFKSCIDC